MINVNLRGLGGLRGHLRRVTVGESYIPQDLCGVCGISMESSRVQNRILPRVSVSAILRAAKLTPQTPQTPQSRAAGALSELPVLFRLETGDVSGVECR
jgi:hypothetical protein